MRLCASQPLPQVSKVERAPARQRRQAASLALACLPRIRRPTIIPQRRPGSRSFNLVNHAMAAEALAWEYSSFPPHVGTRLYPAKWGWGGRLPASACRGLPLTRPFASRVQKFVRWRPTPAALRAVCILRIFAALAIILGASVSGFGQEQTPGAKPRSSNGRQNMPHTEIRPPHELTKKPPFGVRVTQWFDLAPLPNTPPGAGELGRQLDITAPPNSEQITVYGQKHNREADWRADIATRQPVYEPAGSDAAQSLIPYLEYASPEQQRLMSIKTDALGLCGALGGYIQCPNKQP